MSVEWFKCNQCVSFNEKDFDHTVPRLCLNEMERYCRVSPSHQSCIACGGLEVSGRIQDPCFQSMLNLKSEFCAPAEQSSPGNEEKSGGWGTIPVVLFILVLFGVIIYICKKLYDNNKKESTVDEENLINDSGSSLHLDLRKNHSQPRNFDKDRNEQSHYHSPSFHENIPLKREIYNSNNINNNNSEIGGSSSYPHLERNSNSSLHIHEQFPSRKAASPFNSHSSSKLVHHSRDLSNQDSNYTPHEYPNTYTNHTHRRSQHNHKKNRYPNGSYSSEHSAIDHAPDHGSPALSGHIYMPAHASMLHTSINSDSTQTTSYSRKPIPGLNHTKQNSSSINNGSLEQRLHTDSPVRHSSRKHQPYAQGKISDSEESPVEKLSRPTPSPGKASLKDRIEKAKQTHQFLPPVNESPNSQLPEVARSGEGVKVKERQTRINTLLNQNTIGTSSIYSGDLLYPGVQKTNSSDSKGVSDSGRSNPYNSSRKQSDESRRSRDRSAGRRSRSKSKGPPKQSNIPLRLRIRSYSQNRSLSASVHSQDRELDNSRESSRSRKVEPRPRSRPRYEEEINA